MRDIKFRGKLINSKKWAYGNLDIKKTGTAIITPDETVLGTYGRVDSNTIGQYTGLKDKNGKEIYEGDIIEFYLHKNNGKEYQKTSKTLGKVCWREQKPYNCEYNNKILQENPSIFNMPTGFEVKIIYREKENYHSGSWSYFSNCEIVGNIYDNPELLEEKR